MRFALFFLALFLLLAVVSIPSSSSAASVPATALECKERCRSQPLGSRPSCDSKCELYYHSRFPAYNQEQPPQQEEEKEEEEEEEKGENPYVFDVKHFYAGLESEHGRLWMLPKFTNRSALFRGIENYRFAVLEAAPQTFILPDHWDADNVLFVIEGQPTIKLLRPGSRRSINLNPGDILRVKAGTTTYMINRDSYQRIIVAKLVLPVFNPGHFQAFFGGGGQQNGSYLGLFTSDILQYAFNVRKGQVDKVLGQTTPLIQKASPEQIQSMCREEGGSSRSGGFRPFGGDEGSQEGSVNIFQQRPTFSNECGELYEVKADVYKEFLDLNIAVTLANISQGSMMGPLYNTKATKIAYIAGGDGFLEMIAPRDAVAESIETQPSEAESSETQPSEAESSETQPSEAAQVESSSPSYLRISSPLRAGMLVVVPPGYPFVAVASGDQNLQILCYEVFAHNNEKYLIAGKTNVLSEMEDPAMELTYGRPAKEVKAFFNNQKFNLFYPGPPRNGHGGAAAAAAAA